MPHAALRRAVVTLSTAVLVAAGVFAAPALSASASTGADAFPGGIAVPTGTTSAYEASLLASQGNWQAAAAAKTIAAQPTSTWLGQWYSPDQVGQVVRTQLAAAAAQKKTAVFVTYAIPDRGCSYGYDGGLTADTYATWNRAIATALSGHHAAVIVEPDALGLLATCAKDVSSRTDILYSATKALAATGASVYIDAGNSQWVSAAQMTSWLWASGLEFARGWSSNVSNFNATSKELAFDHQIWQRTGKHYVIDVSRNGRGSVGDWCNPWDAGLGVNPSVSTNHTALDALLWVKNPGESDGYCNGGPPGGAWFAAQASLLVSNR